MKRRVALLLIISTLVTLMTGCSSLFSGDTTIILEEQDPYYGFYPKVEEKDTQAVIESAMLEGEGKDAFYFPKNHSRDDIIYFRCLDLQNNNTFVYIYQAYYYGNSSSGLDTYKSGTAPSPTPSPTPSPLPTATPSPSPSPLPTLSPTPYGWIRDPNITNVPTSTPSPTPYILSQLETDIYGSGTKEVDGNLSSEDLKKELEDISKSEESLTIEEDPKPSKMVTVMMTYNFVSRRYKILYCALSNVSTEQSVFSQKLEDGKYLLYFGGTALLFNSDGTTYRSMDLQTTMKNELAKYGSNASITVTGVTATCPNHDIYLNATIEKQANAVNENTPIDESMYSAEESDISQLNVFNIQITYAFAELSGSIKSENTAAAASGRDWVSVFECSVEDALQQNNYYSSWKPYRLNNSQLYLHNADGTYASGYINGWNISGSYFIIDGVTYYFNGSVWCRRTYYNYTRSFKNGDTTDSQTERFYCRLTLFFNPGCFLSTIVTRYASTANAPYYSNGEIIYNGKTGVIYDYDQPTETIVRGNITLSDNIISAAGLTGTSSKKAVFFTSNKVYIVNDGASYNAEASKTGVLIIPLSSIQYGVGTDASVYDANLDRDVGGSINLRDNPDVLSIDNILVYGKYYIFSSAGNGLVFYDTSINRASQLKSNAIYRTFATTSENTLISYGFINEDAPYTYTDQPYAKVIISYVK